MYYQIGVFLGDMTWPSDLLQLGSYSQSHSQEGRQFGNIMYNLKNLLNLTLPGERSVQSQLNPEKLMVIFTTFIKK